MKNNEKTGLGVYIVLLTGLLLLRDVVGVGVNKYVFLILAAVFMLQGSITTIIYMLIYTMPLFCGLPAAHIRLAAIAILLIKKKNLTLQQFIFPIIIILLEVIAATYYTSASFGDVIGYLSAPVMLIYLLWDEEPIDYRNCLKLFIEGFAVVCFVMVLTALKSASSFSLINSLQDTFRESVTQVERTEGVVIKMNANTLAYYAIVSLTITLVLYDTAKKSKSRKLWMAVTLLFMLIGVLTLSRSFILVAVFVLLLYAISKMKTVRGVFAVCSSLVIVGIIVIYLSNTIFLNLKLSLIDRFTGSNIETAGGRTEVFKAYMEAFLSNWRYMLLGSGVTDYVNVIGISKAMHNGTQQIFICMGIPGGLLFLYMLFKPVAVEWEKRIPIGYWIPMIGCLLFIQTIQFLNPANLQFPFLICYYVLRAYSKQKHQIMN